MNSLFARSIALTATSFLYLACSSGDPSPGATSDESAQNLSAGDPSTAPVANGGPSTGQGGGPVGPPTPAPTPTANGGPSTTGGAPHCPPLQKACILADANGRCAEHCVPANVMCVHPICAVCDPAGPRPRPVCQWSTTSCTWECPVCDPYPPPKQGCTWDTKACVWLCL